MLVVSITCIVRTVFIYSLGLTIYSLALVLDLYYNVLGSDPVARETRKSGQTGCRVRVRTCSSYRLIVPVTQAARGGLAVAFSSRSQLDYKDH